MTHHVCIHGHFYQPPRENPWLEAVEPQPSAAPWHDWNARITAECYAANTRARMLDAQGRLRRIVDNFERISFDVGPTLMAWLERDASEVHRRIVEADRRSRTRFDGHGSAMAQGYNHAILPLCNARDLETQVAWGARDFEHRFGRPAEGMWLPETAVDLATLDALARRGVRFTVLAPSQIAAVRPLDDGRWRDVAGERVDTSRPYLARLPAGRSIAIFVYDGALSRAVAFESLLDDGGRLAQRLATGFAEGDRPALRHIATDGESYGHHHRFGEMALAAALERIELDSTLRLSNYAAFLARHPPADEARIVERTAWSCAHGLGRWMRDCGCASEYRPGWHQRWREPLRAALDLLRDDVAPRWERLVGDAVDDPWAARDDYVDVLLASTAEARETFLDDHGARGLARVDRARLLQAFELQRHAMLMYTSCGWFFEELSRIESVQVLRYAARVVELAERLFDGFDPAPFLARLATARGNDALLPDGGVVWRRIVLPSRVDAATIATGAAARALWRLPEAPPPTADVRMRERGRERSATGEETLATEVEVTWHLTGRRHVFEIEARRAPAAPLAGTLRGADGANGDDEVRPLELDALTATDREALVRRAAIEAVDGMTSVALALDAAAGDMTVLRAPVDATGRADRRLLTAAATVAEARIARALEAEPPDVQAARTVVLESARHGAAPGAAVLAPLLDACAARLCRAADDAGGDAADRLDRVRALGALAAGRGIELREAQAALYGLALARRPAISMRAQAGDEKARMWVEGFDAAAGALRVAAEGPSDITGS